MEKKRSVKIAILGLAILISVIIESGCSKVELPIDNAREAIYYAKQDEEVKEVIGEWSQKYRIGFSASFYSPEGYWLVRIVAKNVTDTEFHILIRPNGTIVRKYRVAI